MKNDMFLNLWNGWADGEESRPWNELWLVVDGGAHLTVGNKEYRLKKGDFCMLPDVFSKAHNCNRSENFKLWVIQFEGSLITGSLFKQFSCSDWVVHLDERAFKQIEALFVRSQNCGVHLLPFERVLQVNRDLYILVESFFSRVQLIKLKKNDWLDDTMCYIAEHFGEKLSVDYLAGRAMMHPKHFTRCFRDRVGEPPGRYIAKVRLEQATALLIKGMPLQEISEHIGFQSLQHFFRFFKQHTGMTPREFYNNYKKGGNTYK
jgi:AraC-like DNA-binding protein